MSFDNDWNAQRVARSRIEMASVGTLRIALLFGSAAVALALILAPLLDSQVDDYFARTDAVTGVDTMATGSVRNSESYTIRRSVLQSTPGAVCILHSNGTRSGDC